MFPWPAAAEYACAGTLQTRARPLDQEAVFKRHYRNIPHRRRQSHRNVGTPHDESQRFIDTTCGHAPGKTNERAAHKCHRQTEQSRWKEVLLVYGAQHMESMATAAHRALQLRQKTKTLELQRVAPPQGPGAPPHEVRNASNPQSSRSCFICRVRHHCSSIHLTRRVSIHRTRISSSPALTPNTGTGCWHGLTYNSTISALGKEEPRTHSREEQAAARGSANGRLSPAPAPRCP